MIHTAHELRIEEREFQNVLSGATSRFQLWEQVLRAAHVQTMMEVGVWKGSYAKEILQRCQFIQRYYMVDPWAKLPDWSKPFNVSAEVFEKIFDEAMRNTDFSSSKRVVLRGRAKDVLGNVEDNTLDCAYLDGDHTLRGITVDLIRLLPKVKEGGVIGGDDFVNTPWQHSARYEPTLVCPFAIYFAEAMDLPVVALPFNQFILQKRSNAGFQFIDLTGSYRDVSLSRPPSTITGLVRKMAAIIGFRS